jgi:hypothetical protein
MSDIPRLEGARALDRAPVRVGLERRWRVRLADGRSALLGQLLPELARDEALRRRYLQDVEALRALAAPVVAEIVALGPQPDPRDPGAAPPWRLRLDPPGETLDALLARRGTLAIDETLGLGAELATALHEVHRRGATLRDLHPRQIVVLARPVAGQPRLLFTDVGLARVDVLSTRTAASVVLEGSPYSAPEHLRSGAVDARADLYTWGVIVWRALTGTFPFGPGPAIVFTQNPQRVPHLPRSFAASKLAGSARDLCTQNPQRVPHLPRSDLRAQSALPPAHELREGVPPGLSQILHRCLASDPGDRLRSARELLDWLRGTPPTGALVPAELVACQACGNALPPGVRLCLHCGKAAVQFAHAPFGDEDTFAVDLMTAREDDRFVRSLRGFLEAVSDGPLPKLNFLVGHPSWYSREEAPSMLRTPTRLIGQLSRQSAEELARRLRAQAIEVEARSLRDLERRELHGLVGLISGVGLMLVAVGLVAFSAWPGLGWALGGLGALLGAGGGLYWGTRREPRSGPLVRLRATAAALPASDALVARLCAQLPGSAPDVRQVVGQLALLVQRLVEHRAERAGARGATAELEAMARPVAPLVELVCRAIAALAAIDADLAELDEGALVRAAAASEARGEPRARRLELLDGLERLRTLEEQRGRHLSGLLEAASLLERAVDLALATPDPDAVYEREIRLALASLE